MIPILYDTSETAFVSNGLGRLRDIISCIVSEERNGIYELDFEYPVNGVKFNLIQIGRIVGVTHDETGTIQPFDIVSCTKPINGIVAFHCVHISYRQSYMTVTGSNINSLADAFALLKTAEPENPFNYQTDKNSIGYFGAADGIPHSVRQMLGGIRGSILDAYGGEFEWDKWTVYLHSARGILRDFTIRYGVNMLDYEEENDMSATYSSCIPYWTDGTITVVGDKVDSNGLTITGRGECVPLDLSDKFEAEPTKAQVESAALSYMTVNNTFIPTQSIHVEFIRLQDLDEYAGYQNLLECNLCDTINVIFPDYNSSGQFKIVKTVWDVLNDRYESMELGDLSVTLADALGISQDGSDRQSSVFNTITAKTDIYLDLPYKDTSGTDDYNLYQAIVSLGWQNDVIV
jgi:phage-related protein